MEAERPFLGSSSGVSGLPLILLVGGIVRVELPESVLFVGPLFLLGHGLAGHFVLSFRRGLCLSGGGDGGGGFGLSLEMTILVDLDFVRNFRDGEVSQGDVVELVPGLFRQSGDERTDQE